jgi:cell division protein FtsA
MSKENVITAIDVGSDKVATLIGSYGGERPQLQVVGMAAVSSKGVRKSMIVDLEEVLISIEQSLNAAERMAGFSVNSAFVSVSGVHIRSRNSRGVVAVTDPDQEIGPQDVERVIEAARAVSVPSEREIIHVVPRYFKVDSQEGIRDPVGMTGVRLESEAHIITGLSTSLKNLAKCINDLGVKVDGFVFSGLAAAEATLTETEKELGVVAFDIGAGTSSFCVYTEGVLEYSGALPIGARHITQDIAVGCRISLESAEKIKLALSKIREQEIKPHPGESKKEFSKRKREADKLDLDGLGIDDVTEELSRSMIVKRIMYPRMQEIFTMLGEKLDQEKLLTEIPAGLVISGGGANTVDINLVAKKVLGLPTRTGKPEQLVGLVGEVNSPAFATSVGLLVYGRKQGAGESMSRKINLGEIFRDLKLGRLGQKLFGFLRKLLP